MVWGLLATCLSHKALSKEQQHLILCCDINVKHKLLEQDRCQVLVFSRELSQQQKPQLSNSAYVAGSHHSRQMLLSCFIFVSIS